MEKSRGPLPPKPTLLCVYMEKGEPGYDELPLSVDRNISVRMLCVLRLARLGELTRLKLFT